MSKITRPRPTYSLCVSALSDHHCSFHYASIPVHHFSTSEESPSLLWKSSWVTSHQAQTRCPPLPPGGPGALNQQQRSAMHWKCKRPFAVFESVRASYRNFANPVSSSGESVSTVDACRGASTLQKYRSVSTPNLTFVSPELGRLDGVLDSVRFKVIGLCVKRRRTVVIATGRHQLESPRTRSEEGIERSSSPLSFHDHKGGTWRPFSSHGQEDVTLSCRF